MPSLVCFMCQVKLNHICLKQRIKIAIVNFRKHRQLDKIFNSVKVTLLNIFEVVGLGCLGLLQDNLLQQNNLAFSS